MEVVKKNMFAPAVSILLYILTAGAKMLYFYNFHSIFAPFKTSIYSVPLGVNFRGNFALYPFFLLITARFNPDSRGRSIAHIGKVVPSPTESASRDSNTRYIFYPP